MSSFTDQAITLKRINLAEADRILTILTQYHGKLNVVAKGVRNITSKKGSSSELFNLLEAKIAEGKNLGIMTEVVLLNSHDNLKKDLQKIGQAYYICEIIDTLASEDKNTSEFFPLILDSLNFLNSQKSNGQIERYMNSLEIEILKRAGFWSDKMFGHRKPETLEEWRQFNRIFIEQIIGKRLRTSEFLAKIRPRT